MEPSSPEVMLAFYRRLYPFKSIYNWLNHEHAPTKLFTHREFAFTLPGEVYLRYNSFNSAEELKKQVCTLNPTRFEIGPVYSARPKDKKTVRPSAFSPQLRELVFDIDLTDYDSVRTCCSSASICRLCWTFISAAVRVLHEALTEQFGFKHLLWVYSGRRGIHLWIGDKEAMELNDEGRKAIVGWFEVIKGGKEMGNKVNVRLGTTKNSAGMLPPSLQTALEPLATLFSSLILTDQNCFASEDGYEALLQLLPEGNVTKNLRKKWEADPDRHSADKWGDLKSEVKRFDKGSSARVALTAALEDIILQYTYPRLDAEVSKRRNHLLKAPFCVHPKTGRVCVPVDPTRVDEFDPEAVPDVGRLLRELDEAEKMEVDGEGRDDQNDWERTSLKPYVDMLDRHAMGLMEEVRRSKIEKIDTTW